MSIKINITSAESLPTDSILYLHYSFARYCPEVVAALCHLVKKMIQFSPYSMFIILCSCCLLLQRSAQGTLIKINELGTLL